MLKERNTPKSGAPPPKRAKVSGRAKERRKGERERASSRQKSPPRARCPFLPATLSLLADQSRPAAIGLRRFPPEQREREREAGREESRAAVAEK